MLDVLPMKVTDVSLRWKRLLHVINPVPKVFHGHVYAIVSENV